LTAREYALLEYLMRRQDQVVTKIELLDRVWDAGADTDPNVVEVYVGYLRRKIDQPFERHSLQTVRGAGYRLFDETKADAVRGATGADPIDEIDAHACAGDGATADSMDTAETGAGSAPAPREG
jgi:DNA-binding winged helix-turn-helix (wHTH) protein